MLVATQDPLSGPAKPTVSGPADAGGQDFGAADSVILGPANEGQIKEGQISGSAIGNPEGLDLPAGPAPTQHPPSILTPIPASAGVTKKNGVRYLAAARDERAEVAADARARTLALQIASRLGGAGPEGRGLPGGPPARVLGGPPVAQVCSSGYIHH